MNKLHMYFRPVLSALTIVIVFGAAAFLVLNRVNAEAQNTPQGIVGYDISQLSGDVTVNVKNVQIHEGDVQTELCIEMPSLDPWNPYATLTVDGTVIPNSEVALLNAKDPKVMETPNRCYRFTFLLSTEGSISGKGVLKLDKLWLELGRGQLTDAVVAEVRTRMSTVAPNVDFEVVTTSGKGGGGASINITSKPQGMSNDDVMRLIQQLSIDEVQTNWQAEIELK